MSHTEPTLEGKVKQIRSKLKDTDQASQKVSSINVCMLTMHSANSDSRKNDQSGTHAIS